MSSPSASDAERALAVLRRPVHRALVVRASGGASSTDFLRDLGRLSEWPTRYIQMSPTESTWRYSGISGFLSMIPAPAARALARRLPGPDAPGPDRIAAAVLHLVGEEVTSPLMAVVGGAESMDPESAGVLAHVVKRLGDLPLRVIISTATREEACPFAGIQPFVLTPATDESVADALVDRYGAAVSADVALIVARHSDRRIVRALEIFAELTPEQRVGAAPLLLPCPADGTAATVDAGAEELWSELGPSARTLLRFLAAAPSTPSAAIAALGDEVTLDLNELRRRGVVVHDLSLARVSSSVVRSVTYWSMSPAERAETHQRLLDLVGEDRCARAWHQFQLSPEAAYAIRLIVEATDLVGQGRADGAVEYAEAALTVAAHDHGTAVVVGELAYAFFRAGEFRLAERYLRFSERFPVDAVAEIRNVGVRIGLAFLGRQRILRPLVDDVVARHGARHPEAVARLLMIQAYYHIECWQVGAAQGAVRRARELVTEHAPQMGGQCRVYENLVMAAAGGPVVGHLASETLTRRPTDLLAWARAMTYMERYDVADTLFATLVNAAGSLDRLWLVMGTVLAHDNAMRRGRFDVAQTLLAHIPGEDRHHGAQPRFFLESFVVHETGASAPLDDDGLRLDALRGRDRGVLTPRHSIVAADRSLHWGRYADALREYQAAVRALEDGLPPQLTRASPGIIEAALAVGNRRLAQEEWARFRGLAERFPSRWAEQPLLRCGALLADRCDLESSLQAALDAPYAEDQQFERARTLTTLAIHTGTAASAVRATEQAGAIYRSIGLPGWARVLERRVRVFAQAPLPAGVGAVLTPDQQELVSLVRQGQSNEQIANALHVSKRTVESRLTTIFRLLKVSSRTELMATEHLSLS